MRSSRQVDWELCGQDSPLMDHHVIPNPSSNTLPDDRPQSTYQNHKQQKWREPITRVLQTPSLREHFSAKRKIHGLQCKTTTQTPGSHPAPRARSPGPCTSLVSPAFPSRPAPAPTSLSSQLSVRLATSGPWVARVWGRELGAAPGPGPHTRLRNQEGRPLFPYRGLGNVAALGDVLAVLLVGHTDPLLGDHLRSATTCPGHRWASLARFSSGRCDQRSAPGARAAGARRLSGGALAPAAGPGRGGRGVWALSWARAAGWLTTPDRPAERDGRAGGGEQAAVIFSRLRCGLRRERGVKEEENAMLHNATTGRCKPSPRTTSGSAANVSIGPTPPRGSARSACWGRGRGRAKAVTPALAPPLHAP